MSLLPPPKVGKVAGDVACQSEEGTRLSVLRAVRQAVPTRCSGIRLRRAAEPTTAVAGVDNQTFADIEA